MKMIIFILLIGAIFGQDPYEKLINENVTEQYCKDVIGNMTSIIKDGYVYQDFLKSPKKPEGYDAYLPEVDLIKELNNINTSNRTFYDFYRDIQTILEKAMDGHFSIYALKTPNNFELRTSYFCIPFRYYINEIFDENKEVNDTYLSIEPINFCKEKFSEEILRTISNLKGKKIISINGLEPYKYLEDMGKKSNVIRSSQARYILLSRYIYALDILRYPFKKEELSLKIIFEGTEEVININYQFKQRENFNTEFKKYYLEEQEKQMRLGIPFSSFEEMELKYKIEKGLINNNINEEKDFWDLKSKEDLLKCKVDKENEINVFYQNSFSPSDLYDYENIMYKCFEKFYSNDYKIIIIEDQNGGGYSELCIPFTQYTNPKFSKFEQMTSKSSKLIEDYFFYTDENLNINTCKTYTEKDNILNGDKDKYSNEVIHYKTKYFEILNIFEKKIMEIKRRLYLNTGKTKKPTEIIIFTDGYSFSCTSIFIKGLQTHGGAIIAGYNIRPDLIGTKIDASLSNSPVGTFEKAESVKHLRNLGYYAGITFVETFDPNDKNIPRIPMEFLIYPVDLTVNIYNKYNDNKYDRFIKEAKKIFDKYNKLDGNCNPDNKYLYYETNECDAKLKIEHAHGGYICGSDGKWNTSECIAAYCDKGFILNDNKTECFEDPCESIKLNEITIKDEVETKYKIEPNNIYIFTIENKNKSYSFISNMKYLFYIYNENHILEIINDKSTFNDTNKIFVNYYTNITETIEISVRPYNSDNNNNKNSQDGEGLSTTALVLIIVGSLILLIIILVIIYFKIIKKKQVTNDDVEGKIQSLVPAE